MKLFVFRHPASNFIERNSYFGLENFLLDCAHRRFIIALVKIYSEKLLSTYLQKMG